MIVNATHGTNAFDFLNLASQINPCFDFQYITYPGLGNYVTTICCVKENTTTNFYWFIYINDTQSPVGIDSLVPNNGDILRFEYRFINSTDGNHTDTILTKSPSTSKQKCVICVKTIHKRSMCWNCDVTSVTLCIYSKSRCRVYPWQSDKTTQNLHAHLVFACQRLVQVWGNLQKNNVPNHTCNVLILKIESLVISTMVFTYHRYRNKRQNQKFWKCNQ